MNEAGTPFAERNAKWLLKAQAGINDATFLACPQHEISQDDYLALQNALRRILHGEPISRVLGTQEFWGKLFFLSPATLDPRPETEIIVEKVIKNFSHKGNEPLDILDLGTGTGCILISLLDEFQKSFGVAVELSYDALHMACLNASINGVEERILPVCGSWADSLSHKFDIIVCNPPYIASGQIESLPGNVLFYDPILALDGGQHGIRAIKKIISQIKFLLKNDGKAFIEIGMGQVDNVLRLIEDIDTLEADVHPDMAGIPRVVEISCGDK